MGFDHDLLYHGEEPNRRHAALEESLCMAVGQFRHEIVQILLRPDKRPRSTSPGAVGVPQAGISRNTSACCYIKGCESSPSTATPQRPKTEPPTCNSLPAKATLALQKY